jgi:hypothetical protein
MREEENAVDQGGEDHDQEEAGDQDEAHGIVEVSVAFMHYLQQFAQHNQPEVSGNVMEGGGRVPLLRTGVVLARHLLRVGGGLLESLLLNQKLGHALRLLNQLFQVGYAPLNIVLLFITLNVRYLILGTTPNHCRNLREYQVCRGPCNTFLMRMLQIHSSLALNYGV